MGTVTSVKTALLEVLPLTNLHYVLLHLRHWEEYLSVLRQNLSCQRLLQG